MLLLLLNPVVIGFDSATYRVNEGSGTVELTVSVLSGVLTETLRLSYAVSDVSTTVSDDYTVSGDTLELSLMTSSVTITVDIIDDTSDESEEEFTVESDWTHLLGYRLTRPGCDCNDS